MSMCVFSDVGDVETISGGRKAPSCPTVETWKSADSRLESIRRLPAPWGIGWAMLVLDEGGSLQPRARPVAVEK